MQSRRIVSRRRRAALAALVASVAGLALTAPVRAQADEEPAVTTAAMQWLAETDAGSHGAAWDLSAAFFRAAVGRATWEGAASQVRQPLGAVRQRERAGAKAVRSLPGAPDGDYRILSFGTEFANKANAIETMTLVREADGQWRVTGYFVR
jgi:hypothetical protein